MMLYTLKVITTTGGVACHGSGTLEDILRILQDIRKDNTVIQVCLYHASGEAIIMGVDNIEMKVKELMYKAEGDMKVASFDERFSVLVTDLETRELVKYTQRPIAFNDIGYFLSTILYTVLDNEDKYITEIYEMYTDGSSDKICTGTVLDNFSWFNMNLPIGSSSPQKDSLRLIVIHKETHQDVLNRFLNIADVHYALMKYKELDVNLDEYEFKLNDGYVTHTTYNTCLKYAEVELGYHQPSTHKEVNVSVNVMDVVAQISELASSPGNHVQIKKLASVLEYILQK